jgi:DNA-binding CsgD family transcriptional regulator
LRCIARELDVIDITAPRIMPRMLPRIAGVLGFERMLTYGLHREGSGWCFSFVDTYNLAARDVRGVVASLDAILREAPALPLFDPAHPHRAQRNTVCVLPPLRALLADGLGEWGPPETRPARAALGARLLAAMEPWHIADAHCARTLLCDGAQFLGWIGGYHPEAIAPVVVSRFRRLVPALQRRLRAERLLGLVADPVDGLLAAAIAHVAAPAFVTDMQGHPLVTNDAGRALCNREPVATRALLRAPRAVPPHRRLTLHEVTERGLPAMRLIVIDDPRERTGDVARAFAARHRMTPRQTEVLAMLVSGASNVNIAQALGCAERTVESHVAAIFQRLGCMSRTEVVARVMSGTRR